MEEEKDKTLNGGTEPEDSGQKKKKGGSVLKDKPFKSSVYSDKIASAQAGGGEDEADESALEAASKEVSDRYELIREQEERASATSSKRKKVILEEVEIPKPKENLVPNIAKSEAQIEAESKLAHDPEMQDLIDKVLKSDDEKPSALMGFAKKKNKKEEEFSRQLALAERFKPEYNEGLTYAQAQERKDNGLVNAATTSNAKTYRSIFFQNVFTFFNMLCITVAVFLFIYKAELGNFSFLAIMVINVVISVFQEIKAKRTIERLSLISAPSAVVMRGGEMITVPVNEVVLDDILFLENGKQVPADCIIVRGDVEVNEALLTGESVPIAKKTDQSLYGGSFITSGNCYARVDKVGRANYIESLSAFAKKYKRAKSEIMSSLKLMITVIGALIIPLAIGLGVSNYNALLHNDSIAAGELMRETVKGTAGAIIGMIPAGMFLLTSISLSLSVVKLSKKNVLVQDLYCIEMLARVNVLCLDKTGTITDGTMNVNEVIEFKNNNETGYSFGNIIGSMLTATGDNNQTSVALINKFGYSKVLKPVTVVPFSSQRKFSAVTFENAGTVIMGAPEFIIRDMGVRLETLINEKAKEGLRVLMLAHSTGEIKNDRIPAQRKPLGLIIIEDHIRDDAITTLNWFKENGVAVKVISGDNPVTVSEVACRVGVENAEKYVSLEGLTDPEVVELANQYTVFGRVTPEQKRLLIKSIKAKGNSVAMTGDGVNDILALKEADCSIAIASGSEAARNVSHMVLLDSNFANMPGVVFEGRRVVNNIQKSSSLYLMKTVFSMIMTIMVLMMKDVAYPIQPSYLMPLEFFIIGIPSVCLALQANSDRITGKFLTNIFKNALPAGITLVLGFFTLYIVNATTSPALFGSTQSEAFKAATALTITFTGVIMLFRVCLPIDLYRMTVWALSSFFCLMFCLLMSEFMMNINIRSLNFTQILLVIVIVETSYFLVAILQNVLSRIKINSRERPEEPETVPQNG